MAKAPTEEVSKVVAGHVPSEAVSNVQQNSVLVAPKSTTSPTTASNNSKNNKSSNVNVVFQSPNGLSMEELRAISWKRKRSNQLPTEQPKDK